MRDLSEIRKEIDRIDAAIVELYEKRLTLTAQVADFKIWTGKPVYDPAREAQKLDAVASLAGSEETADQVRRLFSLIMDLSKEQQRKLVSRKQQES